MLPIDFNFNSLTLNPTLTSKKYVIECKFKLKMAQLYENKLKIKLIFLYKNQLFQS